MTTTSDPEERIVLTDYNEVREAFRQRDFKQALYEAGGVVMDDALITLHGDAHRKRRRAENKLFRRGTFRWWELNLVPAIIEDSYRPALAAGSADLVRLGRRTIMYLTALVAGIDPPTDPAEADALERFAEQFSIGATAVHTVLDREALRQEISEAMERFDEQFLAPSWDRRAALIAEVDAGRADESELPRDVLTALLRQQEELGVERPQIRREVAFYLQAGSHSTANLFTHAAHRIFQRIDDPGFAARLDDLTFVQSCVLETLRLHPASPVAWRRSLTEVTLRNGREIPEGALVELDLLAANSDPEVWGPNAADFDPDRELPSGVPPYGHSFGGGTHACIGMELDGGVQQSAAAAEDQEPVYGTVTLMIDALLDNGARPDPEDPATRDETSTRENFARYPVIFGAA